MEGLMDLGIPVKVSTPQITSRPVSMPLKGVGLVPLVSKPFAGFAGYIVDISHTNQFMPFEADRAACGPIPSAAPRPRRC